MGQLNWIDDVASETLDVETPRSWIWWSLVTSISAVAGNNYYLRTLSGKLTYKPNLYVMFLGDSGVGKSYPVTLAKSLVLAADCTRVIQGRSSIQAIVKELSTARSRKDGKPPILDSRGFICNGELSSAVIADVDSLSILTDLYDGVVHKEWDNLLKGEGKSTLKDPYITALFGSSPAGFYDSIPQTNIESGYIGRNLIVYEEKRFQNLDLLDDSEEADKFNDYLIPKYSKHLIAIAANKGRIVPNIEAKKFFNDWRTKWRATQTYDKTGFITRVPDHALKVAMCITLGRYNSSLVMNEFDIIEAIEKVTGLIYANKMTSDGKGLDPLASQTKLVLDLLIRAEENKLTRKQLLSKGYGSYQTTELDKVLETLNEMQWVRKERVVAGKMSDWMIFLSGEPLENYLKWKMNGGLSK